MSTAFSADAFICLNARPIILQNDWGNKNYTADLPNSVGRAWFIHLKRERFVVLTIRRMFTVPKCILYCRKSAGRSRSIMTWHCGHALTLTCGSIGLNKMLSLICCVAINIYNVIEIINFLYVYEKIKFGKRKAKKTTQIATTKTITDKPKKRQKQQQ